ncbi:MAG TPA: multiheme c-type cytochrome, partial [Armatimonadota bacterium]|nr:multiheme c-type cytochrome [Armatimonadota bacterium]
VICLAACLLLGPGKLGVALPTSAHLVVLYTNDTRGELDPCECSELTGGLARRATLVEQIRAEGFPVLLVDSGDIVGRPAKLQPMLDAMQRIGYQHVGLGGVDGLLRDAFVRAAAERGLTVHSLAMGEGVAPPDVVVVEGFRVGIVGVGSDHLGLPASKVCARVSTAVADLESRADLVLILSQMGRKIDRAIASRLSRGSTPVVVVGNRVWHDLVEPENIGRVIIVPTGYLGRWLGRLDVTRLMGATRVEAKLIPVAPTLKQQPDVQRIVKAYYDRERAAAKPAPVPTKAATLTGDPSDCIQCHRTQFDTWLTQKHSRAVATLVAKDKAIPECLMCHSQVYRQERRVPSSEDIDDGVGCLVCHSPAVGHTGEERPFSVRRAAGQAQCIQCHTPERDPDFDYAAALERIRHWDEPVAIAR